jgi:broad specificity phosphatase PhoE
MNGRIILVRHGETEANRRRCFGESEDIMLSEIGFVQAREVGALLAAKFRPQALVSSHFVRARQTSEIIGEVLGLAAEGCSGFHERDFGCLKGQPYQRMGEMLRAEGGDYVAWRPSGGESLDDVRRRAIVAMEALRARFPAQEIVVVCHGAVIQAICAHITGMWSEASVPPNCGFVTIEHKAGVWGEPVRSGEWDEITRTS